MDTLLSMRVFARIVESGSLTRASELTGLTTPRVSALLRQLEQHLRCKLLNRTTRRVSLTEDGSAYYQRCVAVLGEIDDMEASLSRARSAPKGRLKVNLPAAMAKHVVIPALPDFVSKYPDISVELGVTDRQVDIVGEGVDCVVRVGELADSGMVARRIGSMATCTCAAPGYLETHGVPETIDDLAQHLAVHYILQDTGRPRGWEYMVDGKPCIVQMRGTIGVNDADAHVACALAGLGLVKTSVYLVQSALSSGELREVLQAFNVAPRPVSVIHPPNRNLPLKLKLFIEWLSALYAGIPALQGKRA
ncbi:LysR family transcriptional regulator [Paraburkholderia silvatlantica]|uniref:LysR family transcriptional regulator n=1 Tax=Paraburkholderia silvatlantica TaxID=321895 RepID=A0A2U1A795_9BURK|nr:LysR family transcriptional regulator [Paraburkholderia silvatlantica]MBB2931389.1 LysR family transcriptional regulator for bpeEF and oprC [Paraburkholderia silvatlantica]PVY27944.1 LysR family transcriptional regulator [Paraburkholderia silvatlantica]PXW34791.1 LysR family transcriptional regulator [Paraburkholderia silvatlantica]PYE20477.1 LysR family transcriptional regulator [Paraburkholderia silvatlantica]TDQ98657.1 LysR family transcriptional regulator [Paraburkholderia silvatlantica